MKSSANCAALQSKPSGLARWVPVGGTELTESGHGGGGRRRRLDQDQQQQQETREHAHRCKANRAGHSCLDMGTKPDFLVCFSRSNVDLFSSVG